MTIQEELERTSQVDEMLKRFGLDFEIKKIPTTFLWDGQKKESMSFALVNDKLGIEIANCKEGYCVTQNKEVLELILKALTPFGGLTVDNATVFANGRKIFYQIKLNGVSIVGDDEVTKYITIIDSNDSSSSLAVGIGNVTKFCNNQFWSFYGKSEFKFRHSQSLEEKLKLLPQAITENMIISQNLVDFYAELYESSLEKGDCDRIVLHLLDINPNAKNEDGTKKELSTRKLNSKTALEQCIGTEIASKGYNLWGLYSGVTFYTTHESSHPKRKNGRIESQVRGSNYKMNERALDFCRALLKIKR